MTKKVLTLPWPRCCRQPVGASIKGEPKTSCRGYRVRECPRCSRYAVFVQHPKELSLMHVGTFAFRADAASWGRRCAGVVERLGFEAMATWAKDNKCTQILLRHAVYDLAIWLRKEHKFTAKDLEEISAYGWRKGG